MTGDQRVLYASSNYKEFYDFLSTSGVRSILLVCDRSIEYLRLNDLFIGLTDQLGIKVTRFSDFQSNPVYSSVVEGVRIYKASGCDSIVAIGGGSAIDVAKCIKLYSRADGDGENGSWLGQIVTDNDISLFVVPTTAGTGAEATRYAVIYYEGKKQSITSNFIIPNAVLFDPSVLRSLPLYQKKSTAADALCHAVESFWSINSTEESKKYSRRAIRLIIDHITGYLAGDESKGAIMQEAAYIAGKAINISQTTAGHAMSYGLTSRYGISHGHAAVLCVRELWPWMMDHIKKCIDRRGVVYIEQVFGELAEAFRASEPIEGCRVFCNLVDGMCLEHPSGNESDIEELVRTVNVTRLSNHPIELLPEDFRELYRKIICG